MAIETPDFVQLKEIEDKSRQQEQHCIDRHMPPRIVSREVKIKFQFPIEEEYIIRHFMIGNEPFQYNRDGVMFQWIVDSIGSKWIENPKWPDVFERRILVGTIDALLVPAPDATLYTVNIPTAAGV